MDKRHLHHVWRRLKPIPAWVFLVLAITSGAIGIYGLRQNNLKAIKLRDAVIAADKNKGDVETALRELREHIYAHMNADLSSGTGVQQPIQLKYRYDRLIAAEKSRVEKANGNIYTQAQAICEQRIPAGVSGGGRIACIEEYVSNNGVEENPVPESLYKFDFVSPRWSPDIAGFGLLFAGLFFLLFVVRFTLERWLHNRLHAHE